MYWIPRCTCNFLEKERVTQFYCHLIRQSLPAISPRWCHFPKFPRGGATSRNFPEVAPLPAISPRWRHFPPFPRGGAPKKICRQHFLRTSLRSLSTYQLWKCPWTPHIMMHAPSLSFTIGTISWCPCLLCCINSIRHGESKEESGHKQGNAEENTGDIQVSPVWLLLHQVGHTYTPHEDAWHAFSHSQYTINRPTIK